MQIAAPVSALRLGARYDVTHVVDEPGEWFIAAEIFAPADLSEISHLTVLCCTPGGGCTGKYFDLGEPDAGFSFARYAAAAGFACVVVDNLATGQSTTGADPWLSPESVARANAEAFRRATEELRTRVPAAAQVSTVGVGHSMGAMLTLIAQALQAQHTAIACLGFTAAGLPSVLTSEELRVAASSPISLPTLKKYAEKRFSAVANHDGAQQRLEPFPFNLADTDPVGLTALAAAATNLLPLPGYLALLPGNALDYIREITVPVFLGGGDHEPWHRADKLVAQFPNSKDISFYTLIGSAHNHNVAATRELMWRRLLGWATVVTTDRPLAY